MNRRPQPSSEPETGPDRAGGPETGDTGPEDTGRALRPYRPPEVRKRRSLRQATLMSGSAMGGSTGSI